MAERKKNRKYMTKWPVWQRYNPPATSKLPCRNSNPKPVLAVPLSIRTGVAF